MLAAPQVVRGAVLGRDGGVAPSERIVLGAIGIGNRGTYVLGCFLQEPDVQFVAICDVKAARRKAIKKKADDKYGNHDCAMYRDLHELLAREDIEAVLIATGPNWHATASILAANAGKDVYCEKPCTKNIAQSLALAETFRRTGRVFQAGTQRRSLPNFIFAVDLARRGKLGRLQTLYAQPNGLKTVSSGWAEPEPEPDKREVDWDLYLGPAAWRPYNKKLLDGFNFEKGGGLTGGGCLEWGSHCVDLCQWANDADRTAPVEYEPQARICTPATPTASGWSCAIRTGCRWVPAPSVLRATRDGWRRPITATWSPAATRCSSARAPRSPATQPTSTCATSWTASGRAARPAPTPTRPATHTLHVMPPTSPYSWTARSYTTPSEMSSSAMTRPTGCAPRRCVNPGGSNMVTTLHSYRRYRSSVIFAICHWLSAISASALVLSLFIAASPAGAAAAAAEPASVAKERAQISLLQSNAPPAEKAIVCKQLAIYGTKAAVPALAPLLKDPRLASWARIALEAIPDPAADAALRRAMGKLRGNLLVGVINSIGVRRDPKALGGLVKKLKAPEPEVASAAAVALGRIGGADAAKALTQALATTPRPFARQWRKALSCARKTHRRGQASRGCEALRHRGAADVPRQRQLEGIRGAILARQSAGLPLLLEQLRSPDKALFGIGLRTARELPGGAVTESLAAELRTCSPERQPFLLLALADRRDPAVMPAVWEAAGSGSAKLRLTAIAVIERQGNLSSVPVLLKVAADTDPEIAQAALSALTRLPGNDVDADILNRLPSYRGKVRQVLMTVAGQRHIDLALPIAFSSLRDPDPGVRIAAVQAVGILGSEAHAADLVGLLQESQSANEREQIQTAILAIISRTGARSVPALLPLAHNNDSAMRIIALRLLASAGGPDALVKVQAAVQDKDEAVQDEAVRTLSTWPNNWPEDSSIAQPLLTLARSGAKTSHQVLALRVTCSGSRQTTSLRMTRRSARSASSLLCSLAPRRSASPLPPSGPPQLPPRWTC